VLIPDAFDTPGDDSVASRFLLTAFSMASKNGPYLAASAKTGGGFMAVSAFLAADSGLKI